MRRTPLSEEGGSHVIFSEFELGLFPRTFLGAKGTVEEGNKDRFLLNIATTSLY